jgi:hypothetical protein
LGLSKDVISAITCISSSAIPLLFGFVIIILQLVFKRKKI